MRLARSSCRQGVAPRQSLTLHGRLVPVFRNEPLEGNVTVDILLYTCLMLVCVPSAVSASWLGPL
jgi:hypothetical protein